MTVRVTITAWRRSREPEGWDHDPPDVHHYPTREAAEIHADHVRRTLAAVNAARAKRGLYAYRTHVEVEEIP